MQTLITKPSTQDEQRKQICLKQLAQDRQHLLLKWPFIGSIIMRMELVPVRDDRLRTASTNGDAIFVDINFYAQLNREERLFVLAHEVWHCVLLHIARQGNRDHERFNYAADLEIHFMLQNERMSEPFVLPHNRDWKGFPAEEIYELLGTLPPFCSNGQNGNDTPSLPQGQTASAPKKCASDAGAEQGRSTANFPEADQSFDKHARQEAPIQLPDGMAETGDEENASASDAPAEADSNVPNDDVAGEDAVKHFVIDPDYTPTVHAEAVERIRSRVVSAAQQLERRQGKLPAHLQTALDRLQKPSLPWQELLKQFVTTCYGGKRRWLPPSRRHVWQDIYLPSIREERLNAVVALDTSGSTASFLPLFFGELVSLMNSFGKFDLTVLQCDAEIQNIEHFTSEKPPAPDHPWRAKGLGGTDFHPVFDYVKKTFRESPDLLLFFTDGFGSAPNQPPPYPVMWFLTQNGETPASWGRTARFNAKKNT